MNVVAFFTNVGFYHAARLRAASTEINGQGGSLTAVQLTDDTLEHPWGEAEEIITFPLITLDKTKKRSGDMHLPNVPREALMRCLKELKPDVVFLPGWSFSLSLEALKWCCTNDVPAVVMSESKWDDERRSWWKERIKSYLYVRKFSAALVGGRIHADYALSLGIPCDRIFTGYDAVDNLHFRRMADMAMTEREVVRKRHPVIPQRPYFMAVLRLIPRKNISRLIDAYAIYRRKTMMGDPWDLVICGNGQEKAVLEEKVRKMGLEETIHFPGFISYHEIGFWYGLAEAFVHPALVEQWGLVVNEACAAGLPILCSDTVGARYDLVIDGENGFLFDPYNIDEMADSLSKMHGVGETKRESMGMRSRQIVESCSIEVFTAGFLSAARAALERC